MIGHLSDHVRRVDLDRLTRDDPAQHGRVTEIRRVAQGRMGRLDAGIRVRREQGFEAARETIVSGLGKGEMEAWEVEMMSLNHLKSYGWMRTTIKAGDRITCTGGRARSGVVPLQRSRHSTSFGASRSGSSLQPPSPRTDLRREMTSAGTGAVMGGI